jgi:hypothetical protein
VRQLAVVSVILLALSGCTFQSHVIHVTLINAGTREARNIEFRYPGGSFGVASLAPGKTYEYRIKPFYTGSVEVECAYGDLKLRSTVTRVEKEQEGKATVSISEMGVKWEGLRREH